MIGKKSGFPQKTTVPTAIARYTMPRYRTAVFWDSWEYESPSTTIIAEWDLVCNRRRLLSLASAIYMLSAMVTVPVMSIVSDSVGRSSVISYATLILLPSGFASCFAPNFVLFVCARCVVSACASTAYVITFILLVEVTSTENRTSYAIFATCFGTAMFNCVFIVLSLFQLPWRSVQLIIMGLTCMLIVHLFVVEESPRWLLAGNRFERAEQSVLWIAKVNRQPLDAVREIYRRLTADVKQLEIASLLRPSPLLLFTSAPLRPRCFALFTSWFAMFFSYYGLSLSSALQEEFWLPIASTVSIVLLGALVYPLTDRYGRRTIFIVTLFLLGGTCAVWIATYKTEHRYINNIFSFIAIRSSHLAGGRTVSASFMLPNYFLQCCGVLVSASPTCSAGWALPQCQLHWCTPASYPWTLRWDCLKY